MDGEDESGGLFNIEVGSDEEREAIAREEKVPRDFQSEEDFQQVVKTWRPKVEVGEVSFYLHRPISNRILTVSQALENSQTPIGQSFETGFSDYFARN